MPRLKGKARAIARKIGEMKATEPLPPLIMCRFCEMEHMFRTPKVSLCPNCLRAFSAHMIYRQYFGRVGMILKDHDDFLIINKLEV